MENAVSGITDYYDLSRIRPEVQRTLERINALGREKFTGRAAQVDLDASFPVENHKDLVAEGLLTLVVPEEFGGMGFSLGECAMVGAEIDKHCGANSRDLVLKDVLVTEDDMLMLRGIFIKTLPHFPHLMITLSPSYMGLAQGAYGFTVDYPRGRVPGQPPADRRMYATKRMAFARMYAKLAQTRALWWQALMEAKPFRSKAKVMRMYAAQFGVMEGAQEIAALAIRTCGGQSMLKSLPLERMYRDSRCGALMLPYTSGIMEDYLSVLALYDLDELDRARGDECGARNSLWRGARGAVAGAD
jgi:alkylation response protein AidB-like acyl-CoA dehydrogenase